MGVNLVSGIRDLLLHESLNAVGIFISVELLEGACLDGLLVNSVRISRLSLRLGQLLIDDAELLYLFERGVNCRATLEHLLVEEA